MERVKSIHSYSPAVTIVLHLVSSLFNELRFGLDTSIITRIYYLLVPYQVITQEQIAERLKVCTFKINSLFSLQYVRLVYLLYDSNGKI